VEPATASPSRRDSGLRSAVAGRAARHCWIRAPRPLPASDHWLNAWPWPVDCDATRGPVCRHGPAAVYTKAAGPCRGSLRVATTLAGRGSSAVLLWVVSRHTNAFRWAAREAPLCCWARWARRGAAGHLLKSKGSWRSPVPYRHVQKNPLYSAGGAYSQGSGVMALRGKGWGVWGRSNSCPFFLFFLSFSRAARVAADRLLRLYLQRQASSVEGPAGCQGGPATATDWTRLGQARLPAISALRPGAWGCANRRRLVGRALPRKMARAGCCVRDRRGSRACWVRGTARELNGVTRARGPGQCGMEGMDGRFSVLFEHFSGLAASTMLLPGAARLCGVGGARGGAVVRSGVAVVPNAPGGARCLRCGRDLGRRARLDISS